VRAAGPGNASLVAAIAENATRSEVARGENAGRTLHHVAVVRIIKDFGSDFGSGPTGSRTLELSGASLLRAEKDGQPLRLVVLLVSHKDFHVAGAAEQTLRVPPSSCRPLKISKTLASFDEADRPKNAGCRP
jgi:hypothetical protein